MAHGDYHCCAICDRKMDYAGWDARTKEDVCGVCGPALAKQGVFCWSGSDVLQWLEVEHPLRAAAILASLGFSKCYYANPVDDRVNVILAKCRLVASGAFNFV